MSVVSDPNATKYIIFECQHSYVDFLLASQQGLQSKSKLKEVTKRCDQNVYEMITSQVMVIHIIKFECHI